jgi:hypothetical protein
VLDNVTRGRERSGEHVQMCSFLRCCVRCRVNNNQIRCTVSLVATMRWQMRLLDLVWAEHAGFMDILLSRRHIWIITAGLNLLFNRIPRARPGAGSARLQRRDGDHFPTGSPRLPVRTWYNIYR